MAEDYSPLHDDERLRAENDFIKMKLMLEKGAKFETLDKNELSPGMENEFLNYIMEYEKQAENPVMVKVFDKIGRPDRFKPANELSERDVEKAWSELSAYLEEHGINLDVCSPNISTRELYRFAVEELFEYDMADMNIPGMVHGFIYDEFHPDPLYESERVVAGELFPSLFKIEPVSDYFMCLHRKEVWLNGKLYPKSEEVRDAFNHFKSYFSSITLLHVAIDQCNVISAQEVFVQGNFKAQAQTKDTNTEFPLDGGFAIELQPDELGYWSIKRMQLGAISF